MKEHIQVIYKGRPDIGTVVSRDGDLVEADFGFYRIIAHVDNFEIVGAQS